MQRYIEVLIFEWMRKSPLLNILMTLPSTFYGAMVSLRHLLYDRGIFSQKKVFLPVVSVGNLIVGGTGKTQLSLLLAKELNKQVAIISRGYRREVGKRREPFIVDNESQLPGECGDEPWLLAAKLPKAMVVVAKDRFKGALHAKKKGAGIIVLDDGMQHRRLYRDVEIVLIDSADPFGGGHFLPKGLLRENPKRLANADLVVVVGSPSPDLEERLLPFTQAPLVYGRISAKRVWALEGSQMGSLQGSKVGLFCGIGNPTRFVHTVKELGAHPVATYFLPDHKPIGKRALLNFAALSKGRGAEILLCTEKDRIKLPWLEKGSALPIGWVETAMEIVKNRKAWDNIVCQLQQ